MGSGERLTGLRLLIGRAHLVPLPDRLCQGDRCLGGAALGEGELTAGNQGGGSEDGASEVGRYLLQLGHARSSTLQVARGDCDLHHRWEKPRSEEPIPWLALEGPRDGGEGRNHIAPGEQQKGVARLRKIAELVALPECLLSAGQVTNPEPDLTQLAECVARHGRVVVGQLRARPADLLLSLAEGAPKPEQLRPVDAADARKAGDRLPLAPAIRGLGPFARPGDIGQIAADGDGPTVDQAGGPGRQLAAHGGRADLVDQAKPRGHLAPLDQRLSLDVDGQRPEVAAFELDRQLDGPPEEQQGAVGVPRAKGCATLAHGQLALLHAFRLVRQKPLCSGPPAAGDRALEAGRVGSR